MVKGHRKETEMKELIGRQILKYQQQQDRLKRVIASCDKTIWKYNDDPDISRGDSLYRSVYESRRVFTQELTIIDDVLTDLYVLDANCPTSFQTPNITDETELRTMMTGHNGDDSFVAMQDKSVDRKLSDDLVLFVLNKVIPLFPTVDNVTRMGVGWNPYPTHNPNQFQKRVYLSESGSVVCRVTLDYCSDKGGDTRYTVDWSESGTFEAG